LAILGTAVAYRELRGLLALAIIFIAFVLKSRLEETFMLQHFGSQYSDYAQRVKALIPFVY
jgi:protein-S-isoprenylcysteine O-methyltransferase Ste14